MIIRESQLPVCRCELTLPPPGSSLSLRSFLPAFLSCPSSPSLPPPPLSSDRDHSHWLLTRRHLPTLIGIRWMYSLVVVSGYPESWGIALALRVVTVFESSSDLGFGVKKFSARPWRGTLTRTPPSFLFYICITRCAGLFYVHTYIFSRPHTPWSSRKGSLPPIVREAPLSWQLPSFLKRRTWIRPRLRLRAGPLTYFGLRIHPVSGFRTP